MSDNRRRTTRVHSLNFVAQEGHMFRTLDVSSEGMLLEMPVPPPLGTRMQLRLAVGDEVADVAGQVVRHVLMPDMKVGVGIHFENLTPGARALLAARVAGASV